MKRFVKILKSPPLSPICKVLYDLFTLLQYRYLCIRQRLKGFRRPSAEEAQAVADKVTFICKSFERQYMAKRLYRSIQKYYPGTRVIIADDSKKPLKLKGSTLTVVQLPFNSGLSRGLNEALRRVETPYTMRLDDDTLLLPTSDIHGQLAFLEEHSNVDLVAVQACSAPYLKPPREAAKSYVKFDMRYAPKPLLIAHMTKLDKTHFVMGKVTNLFLVRTEPYKRLGYDDRIRMIDHHEFFMRAAGNIVSAMDISASVFHYHNPFDAHYSPYRSDYLNDAAYIREKYGFK